MEKEISSGTMLGIVLIALAAVIGLGFGVFSIAKGVANEGTVGVQDNLNTVTDSAFEDYNDKVVTGTQVKSAIQNFEGKSVAILINTTAMNKGVVTYPSRSSNATVFEVEMDGSMKPYVNYNALLAKDSDGNHVQVAIGKVTYGDGDDVEESGLKEALEDSTGRFGIPKNKALIDIGTGDTLTWDVTLDKLNNGGNPSKMKDGVLMTDHAFAINNSGKVQVDVGIGGLSRTGNCEYVSTSSKFTANLIKDTSGTNIGILFTQLEK